MATHLGEVAQTLQLDRLNGCDNLIIMLSVKAKEDVHNIRARISINPPNRDIYVKHHGKKNESYPRWKGSFQHSKEILIGLDLDKRKMKDVCEL